MVITDAVPANTTLVSPGTCTVAGTTVKCSLGNQNPGATGAVSLQVRVNTPLANGTVINNAARISGQQRRDAGGGDDHDDGAERSPVHAEQERGERHPGGTVADVHDRLVGDGRRAGEWCDDHGRGAGEHDVCGQ